MVNTYGVWAYESNTPERNKCFLDRVADMVIESGYEIKTSIENLVYMIVSQYDGYRFETGTEESFSFEGLSEFVRMEGGFSDFDYYC